MVTDYLRGSIVVDEARAATLRQYCIEKLEELSVANLDENSRDTYPTGNAIHEIYEKHIALDSRNEWDKVSLRPVMAPGGAVPP